MRPVWSPSSRMRSERLDLLDDRALVDRRDELVEAAPARGDADRLRLGERDLRASPATATAHAAASSPRIACSSCSSPPVSTAQWIPHSFGAFASHHQRPARPASPGAIARVHGAQPIEV